MSTRSEFCEIVGLSDPSAAHAPSEAIRSLWTMMADHYSVVMLTPLWKFHSKQLSEYVERIGRPTGVLQAGWQLLVAMYAFDRLASPNDYNVRINALLAEHASRLTDPNWSQIQDAIEKLADAWEEIGF